MQGVGCRVKGVGYRVWEEGCEQWNVSFVVRGLWLRFKSVLSDAGCTA